MGDEFGNNGLEMVTDQTDNASKSLINQKKKKLDSKARRVID